MSEHSVGFKVHLEGDTAVLNGVRQIQNSLNQIRDRKINLQLEKNNIQREILKTQEIINELTHYKKTVKLDDSELKEVNSILNKLNQQVKDLTLSKRSIGLDMAQATSEASQLRLQLDMVKQRADAVRQSFQNIGSALQTAGSFMQGAGNLLGGNFVSTAKTMVSAFATMGLYGAAQGTVQRYDIMKMYPRQMKLLGFRFDEAAASVDKLEQSVIGLPTGLDEIVESARQLVTLTGDLEKGTDIAIAANNALLAGGADTQQQTWGQRQLRDLLAAGQLRSQEWESLIKALGPGLKDIGEAIGYKDFGKFRSELKQNKIAAEDFFNALIKVGTGEGVLAQRAELYKDTISATARNIKNALQKLGAAGLDTLDSVLSEKTGKGLTQTIVEVSDAIKQKMVPALESWIRAHSGEIVSFLDRLKNYDWTGFIGKVGSGLAKYYDLISKIFTKFADPKWAAFFAVWGSPIGRALNALGSFVSGLGGVVAKIMLWKGIGGAAGKVAAITKTVKAVGGLGTVMKASLMKFANIGGYLVVAAGLGGVIAEFAKVIELIGNIKIGNDFGRNAAAVTAFGTVVAAITTALVTIMGAIGKTPGGAAAALIGEGLSAGLVGVIAMIGGVIAEYAKIVDLIATINVPSTAQMSKVANAVEVITTDILGNVKKVPSSSVVYLDRANESIKSIAKIAQSIKDIKSVGNIGNMSGTIDAIAENVKSIIKMDISRADRGDVKRAAKVLGETEKAMDSIGGIAESLMSFWETMKGVKIANIDALKRRADFLLDATSQIFKGYGDQKKLGARRIQAEHIKVISDAMTDIGSIATNMMGAWSTLKGVKKDQIRALRSRMTTMVEELTKVFQGEQYRTFEKQVVTEGNVEALATSIGYVKDIAEHLVNAEKNLNHLIPESPRSGSRGRKPINVIRDGILDVLRAMNDMVSNINTDDLEKAKTAAANVEPLAEAVTSIASIVSNLDEAQGSYKNLKFGKKGGWEMGRNLETVINRLVRIGGILAGGEFDTLSANATSLKKAVDNIGKMVTALKTVQTNMQSLGVGADGSWALGKQISSIIGWLNGSLGGQSFGQMALTSATLSHTAESLVQIAASLGMIAKNAGDAGKNLTSAAKGVETLGKRSSEHRESISKVAASTAGLRDAVKGIGGAGITAAVGVGALGQASKNQASNIQAAATAASNLAGAISRIPSSKTVSVSVTGNGTRLVGSSGTGVTNGGYGGHGHASAYASGGLVLGRGGIDMIRARLTNGEFVQRRAAVQHFGTQFMDRINHLDFEGALRAVSVKAASKLSNRGSVVNNYRDNHANVTMNINRASQGYSQRVASRWVRALT